MRPADSRLSIRLVASPADRRAAFAIRRRVFQGEQRVPAEIEFDADDDTALHVLAEIDGEAVGTGRLIVQEEQARIGRMAVLATSRRRGIGTAVLERLVDEARGRGAGSRHSPRASSRHRRLSAQRLRCRRIAVRRGGDHSPDDGAFALKRVARRAESTEAGRMKELKGKVAVITGAASGIGRAMADTFGLPGDEGRHRRCAAGRPRGGGWRAVGRRSRGSSGADRREPRSGRAGLGSAGAGRLRRRSSGLQQRRRVRRGAVLGVQSAGLRVGSRGQSVGRRARGPHLRPDPSGPGQRSPYRQHGLDGRRDQRSTQRRLQHEQARGRVAQ